MKWLIFALLLCAFTPIYTDHDVSKKVNEEFKNLENTVQDQEFRIMNSTPVLSELKDREVVIVSTLGINSLMWRNGQDIYSVRGSCVTFKR